MSMLPQQLSQPLRRRKNTTLTSLDPNVHRPRSYPARRMYVRGLLRQLGSPALLAASYSGNPAAVASAAVAELEAPLVACLDELARQQAAAEGGTGSTGGTGGSPDWTHVFLSVLPPLPLPPSSTSGGTGGTVGGVRGRGDGDAKVAAALRAAMAALVARHISAFRQVG